MYAVFREEPPFSPCSGQYCSLSPNVVLHRSIRIDDGRKGTRRWTNVGPTTDGGGVDDRRGDAGAPALTPTESDRTKFRWVDGWDVYVIAHGGAGSPADEPDDRAAVLDEAVDCGADTKTPLSAVRATVRVLEIDPRFNAGIGGAVQSDGVPRTDAGVMCGDGRTGAAAAMSGVAHAVDVAGAVATETPHVMLAGERAVAFADSVGVETGIDLWSDASRERWAEADPPDGGGAGGASADTDAQLAWVRERFGSDGDGTGNGGDGNGGGGVADSDGSETTERVAPPRDHDTVGAVATDGERVAAATSTGGRWYALAGRVGDVPQVGAGFFATPAGGASATGAGEDIAREGLARRAVELLEQGADASTAARIAIEEFDEATESDAGVVVMDSEGRAGEAYNSPAMQTARY